MLLRQVTRDAEHPFDVARHRDAFWRATVVGDPEYTHLYRIVSCHGDLNGGVYVRVLMVEDRVASAMLDDVFGHLADRGRCRGPDIAGLVIAQVNAVAAWITDGIFVPRRYAIEEAALRRGTTIPSVIHAATAFTCAMTRPAMSG